MRGSPIVRSRRKTCLGPGLVVLLSAVGCTVANPDYGEGATSSGGRGGGGGMSSSEVGAPPSGGGGAVSVATDAANSFDTSGGAGGTSNGAGGAGNAGTDAPVADVSGPFDVTNDGERMHDVLADSAGAADTAIDTRPAGCGSSVLDISGIGPSDGLAMGDDGTLYYTSDDGVDGWIGRLAGGTLTPKWLRVPNRGRVTTGLALDHARQRLYLADLTNSSILAYDLTAASPSAATVVTDAAGINDLALDATGTIYYSSQSTKHVHRVVGNKSVVVTNAIVANVNEQAPAGLAFASDGQLLVGLRRGGAIVRLRLTGGMEQSRGTYGFFTGWANGLSFDTSGRLYVATYYSTMPGMVLRISANGMEGVQVASGATYASMAFGRGPVDCHDLYVASPTGPMQRIRTDTPGLPLP
ncbi:MAG TPA: hypothetical protein VGF45_20270 [Polyangia bacterium]